MTEAEIIQFKEKFANIVSLNTAINKHASYIRDLHVWDKNDSHKNAILNGLTKRDKMKLDLAKLLCENSYEDLQKMGKKLSNLRSRLMQARTDAVRQRLSTRISELKYPF